MGYETYSGIVAREVDVGDADRYLTLLTVESGKLECYAKGIRGKKSKLASQAGLMTYGEFYLFKNKDRLILTSAKASEHFYDIRTDVEKCAYAAHFLEIARDVIVESQAFAEALQTLLNALYVLCYRELQPEFVSRVFELRILALAGFAPALDRCSICGAPFQDGGGDVKYGFAVDGDGLVCASAGCEDAAGRLVRLSPGAVRAIRYVSGCGARDIFNFTVNAEAARDLAASVPEYLQYHFGKEYSKLGEVKRYRTFEREMNYKIIRKEHDK